MKVTQYHYTDGHWQSPLPVNATNQLLFAFGDRNLIKDGAISRSIKDAFPLADCVGCSTSGEIIGQRIDDGSLVLTAVELEATTIQVNSVNVTEFKRSFDAGLALAKSLERESLSYVLVFADGQLVNGTELVDGFNQQFGDSIPVSGGLAGDEERFEETMVWHNNDIESGLIVAVGFYGDAIHCGHGTLGGWDAFGPERQVSKSSGNILYELDGKPALELYKRYLGEYSDDLPSSALLFPLHVRLPNDQDSVVRTILNIDENEQSMTFAGDIPQGSTAQLMRANFDRLIDGAQGAAISANRALEKAEQKPSLALLISCVGRRLVLGPRTEEELDAVAEVVGEQAVLCGFYSYGEISPLVDKAECRLHNQTMTITTFSEQIDA